MIDRENRNKVAEQARHYVSGLIDNDALDDSIFNEFTSNDTGLKKVTWQLWYYYDDLSTHKKRRQAYIKQS